MSPAIVALAAAAVVVVVGVGVFAWTQFHSGTTYAPALAASSRAGANIEPTARATSSAGPTNPGGYPAATKGHPIFVLDTASAGASGQRQVFHAAGVGPMTTLTFTLRGGSVSGAMSQAGKGVYFYLQRVGGKVQSTPAASCTEDCAYGGWASRAPVPAGTYRLVVRGAPDLSWNFSLTEQTG
jgi:hypothetical protein